MVSRHAGNVSKMVDVLVVAAHPDDEILGAGGAMAYHSAQGQSVGVVFMSAGVGARGETAAAEVNARLDSARKAVQAVNGSIIKLFDFPDNQFDSVPLLKVVQFIEEVVRAERPQIIYTHSHYDLNIDHQITARATLTACRPLASSCVRKLLAFEIPSSTEWRFGQNRFQPNHFIDISKYWDKKMAAINAYEQEMRPMPHPRSQENIEALATHRGAGCGVLMAEAFELIFELVR